jgi:hypothetical protein
VKLFFFGLPALGRLQPPFVAPGNGLQVASLQSTAYAEGSQLFW